MMNITKARKIAADVGAISWTNSDRRNAFHRLDMSTMNPHTLRDVRSSDLALARNIWDFFGDRALRGKSVS